MHSIHHLHITSTHYKLFTRHPKVPHKLSTHHPRSLAPCYQQCYFTGTYLFSPLANCWKILKLPQRRTRRRNQSLSPCSSQGTVYCNMHVTAKEIALLLLFFLFPSSLSNAQSTIFLTSFRFRVLPCVSFCFVLAPNSLSVPATTIPFVAATTLSTAKEIQSTHKNQGKKKILNPTS